MRNLSIYPITDEEIIGALEHAKARVLDEYDRYGECGGIEAVCLDEAIKRIRENPNEAILARPV